MILQIRNSQTAKLCLNQITLRSSALSPYAQGRPVTPDEMVTYMKILIRMAGFNNIGDARGCAIYDFHKWPRHRTDEMIMRHRKALQLTTKFEKQLEVLKSSCNDQPAENQAFNVFSPDKEVYEAQIKRLWYVRWCLPTNYVDRINHFVLAGTDRGRVADRSVTREVRKRQNCIVSSICGELHLRCRCTSSCWCKE